MFRGKRKERIELDDNYISSAMKLADGNPGAVRVLAELYSTTPQVDPDCMMGGFGSLLGIDSLGIYGPAIWMLYKDVCYENILNVHIILRGWQLGYIREEDIHATISSGRTKSFDFPAILAQIQERLPEFGPKAQAASATSLPAIEAGGETEDELAISYNADEFTNFDEQDGVSVIADPA